VKKPSKEKILVRHISSVVPEDAHGGSGKRKMVYSHLDVPKSRLEAVSVGYLPKNGTFDWHMHNGIDEVIAVTKGKAAVDTGGRTIHVRAGDYLLVPSRKMHRITNPGPDKMEALYVRFRR